MPEAVRGGHGSGDSRCLVQQPSGCRAPYSGHGFGIPLNTHEFPLSLPETGCTGESRHRRAAQQAQQAVATQPGGLARPPPVTRSPLSHDSSTMTRLRALAAALLLLLAAADAANFETAIATGEQQITSIWETGYCGAIMCARVAGLPPTAAAARRCRRQQLPPLHGHGLGHAMALALPWPWPCHGPPRPWTIAMAMALALPWPSALGFIPTLPLTSCPHRQPLPVAGRATPATTPAPAGRAYLRSTRPARS